MSLTLAVDEELELHRLQHQHTETLFELVDRNRDYLERWLPFPPLTKSSQDIADFIKKSNHAWGQREGLVCLILWHQQAVGIISFNKIMSNLSKTEIGYWLDQSQQGQGIMTRACQRMIHFAFEELQLSKVEIRAARENRASRAVCERLGCQLEGIITQSEKLHGQLLDHAIYACHRDRSLDVG